MTDDAFASMRAAAEGLDKLRDDLPRALANMRAAGCSEMLVLQYRPLVGRIVALFEELKVGVQKEDLKALGAVSDQMQAEQANLSQLVQSIWNSAERSPQ